MLISETKTAARKISNLRLKRCRAVCRSNSQVEPGQQRELRRHERHGECQRTGARRRRHELGPRTCVRRPSPKKAVVSLWAVKRSIDELKTSRMSSHDVPGRVNPQAAKVTVQLCATRGGPICGDGVSRVRDELGRRMLLPADYSRPLTSSGNQSEAACRSKGPRTCA